MSHSVEIDEARQIARITLHGAFTRDTLVAIWRQLAEQGVTTRGYVQWIDLREADLSAVAASDVRTLAGMSGRPARAWVFIASKPLAFGLARMFEGSRGASLRGDRIAVFSDVREATDWLAQID